MMVDSKSVVSGEGKLNETDCAGSFEILLPCHSEQQTARVEKFAEEPITAARGRCPLFNSRLLFDVRLGRLAGREFSFESPASAALVAAKQV